MWQSSVAVVVRCTPRPPCDACDDGNDALNLYSVRRMISADEHKKELGQNNLYSVT